MFSEGDRMGWLNAVAARIQDGGLCPPSLSLLYLTVPPLVLTRESDGHCTAAAAFGEDRRKDMEAGWQVIIGEMVGVLREQGFVGGSDEGLTWIKPVDGTWRVPMPDGSQPKVFGQRERRMAHDRAFVGERSAAPDAGVEHIGIPSKFKSGRIHPLELQVIGPRGGITTQRFELHPLALAIPPMTEDERELLRASIERDGVKVPIEIYQKKILDGRNRAYFAAQLGKPVHLSVFEGTEEEARRHVLTLNIHRRHLNVVQLAIMAVEYFSEKATRMAAESYRQGVTKPRQSRQFSVETTEPKKEVKHADRVVELAKEAGIKTTRPAVEAIKEMIQMGAPETIAKAKEGKWHKLSDAKDAASDEVSVSRPKVRPTAHPRSVHDRLGTIITHLDRILLDHDIQPGNGMPDEISGRIKQAHKRLYEVERVLRERKIIP